MYGALPPEALAEIKPLPLPQISLVTELEKLVETLEIEDGVSMVYSFFQPGLTRQSLGTFLILDHVYIAHDVGLPYVYLGYWVPGSEKMAYKSKFSGLEVYVNGKWQNFDEFKDRDTLTRPEPTESIAQQVSNISLPDPNPRSQQFFK